MKKTLALLFSLVLIMTVVVAVPARAQTTGTCGASSSITDPACASLVQQLLSLIAVLKQQIATLTAAQANNTSTNTNTASKLLVSDSGAGGSVHTSGTITGGIGPSTGSGTINLGGLMITKTFSQLPCINSGAGLPPVIYLQAGQGFCSYLRIQNSSGKTINTLNIGVPSDTNFSYLDTSRQVSNLGDGQSVDVNLIGSVRTTASAGTFVEANPIIALISPTDTRTGQVSGTINITSGTQSNSSIPTWQASSITLPNGTVGQSYSYDIPFNYSGTDNVLVGGWGVLGTQAQATLNSSGQHVVRISGTPTTAFTTTLPILLYVGFPTSQASQIMATMTVTGPSPLSQTPQVSITASPSTITAGQSTTLTMSLTGTATYCSMGGQYVNLQYQSPLTMVVSPTTNASYTVTCSNSFGSNSASVDVTVNPASSAQAPVVTLSVSPTSITAGGSALLYATNNLLGGQNGALCYLNGQQTALGGGPNGMGMSPMTVNPTQTTTYTYMCTNSAGSNSANATLTVNQAQSVQPPTVTVTANPTTITAGQSTTITMSLTGTATYCSMGGQYVNLQYQSPLTMVVSPSTTATYEVICSNSAGSGSGSAKVTVNPAQSQLAPITNMTISPGTITAGQSATLTLNPLYASYCTWPENVTVFPASKTVSPTQTTSYLATCYNSSGQSASTNGTLIVNPAQQVDLPTVTVTANPSTITAGQSTTITITETGATSCNIGGQYLSLQNGVPGTLVVSPSSSASYQVFCSNSAGSKSATANVTVNTAASTPVVQLTASPSSITLGQSTTLTESISGGPSYCNRNYQLSNTSATAGFTSVAPQQTTTYTLTCYNSVGQSSTISSTVTVTANNTTIPANPKPTVNLSANPTSIAPGQQTTLSWSSTNATSCNSSSGTWYNGSSYATIPTSGYRSVTPQAGVDYVSPTNIANYYVSCFNSAGGTTASAPVTITGSTNSANTLTALLNLLDQLSAALAH